MDDRFFNFNECVKRLECDYKKHGSLIVAFDFDNTVFDYHKKGDTYSKVENILRESKSLGFKLLLFTSNSGEKLDFIIETCKYNGYGPDYLNKSPVMNTVKPYFNILLDDRAGLYFAYNVLKTTIKNIKHEQSFNK